MKNKKYHTVGTISKSNIKIVDRSKIDTTNTNTRPLTFLAWYGHFNKRGGHKLV
jgi:hypothetical protein